MSRDPRDQAPGDRPEHPATPADGDDAAVDTPAVDTPAVDTPAVDTPAVPGTEPGTDDDSHDAEPAPARTDDSNEDAATPVETDPGPGAPSGTPHDDPVDPAAVPDDPTTSSDAPAARDQTTVTTDHHEDDGSTVAGTTPTGAAPTGAPSPSDPGTSDPGTPVSSDPTVPGDAAAAGERPAPDDRTDDPRTATTPPDRPTPGATTTPEAAAPEQDAETAPTAEPDPVTGATAAVGRHGTPTQPEPRGLRGLGRAMRPRASRSQVMVGVLCALLGFALVVQVSQTQEDQLSSLRQSDLVRLLDDVTQRSGELEEQVSSLEATRDELQSGSGRERAALELAEQQAETLGILSGRLPAEGPGVEIEVVEGAEPLKAFGLFNVLEELRNAGAEAMEVNGVRLVASSYFEDTSDGVVVDGQVISSPYRWTAIGDPSTLETALEIPGGAMASLRADGARTTVTQQDQAEVTATVEPRAPRYATPVPADE
ncbi:Uncharacterized conserved protein YlxW, UPF0749 family [Cellulosimicrobium aquatile]|uniref:Uncharacterized conserved protein YlxW, UPF0749 family n=1 Tax=Cellulosimicrobium aquatile TaxID=1612203 RepID=A0A1N6RRJ3_9MICO|nr:DUF881 domain-containing protein [Cellulosimicrobium aquatile]SIQ31463.1 Uncharacterized conserved protein YlxW, UPF0749 family [Cellulosimicrobium aquatile]